jgi:hypothetical protein
MSFFSLGCCININKQIIEEPSVKEALLDSSLNIPDISGIINIIESVDISEIIEKSSGISEIINNYSDISNNNNNDETEIVFSDIILKNIISEDLSNNKIISEKVSEILSEIINKEKS